MKRTLVLAAVLLLTCSLAWAEEAAPAEPVADPSGGCELPDLTGLSPDQITAAALEAGFQMAPTINAQPPACPVTFHCNSITNCGIGLLCGVANLGPCCTAGGGLHLCCINGTIKVRSCQCRCTCSPCSITCPNSNEVNWGCS